ncbi:hypothetical protein IEQ34_011155 [Dendrobium chrysotoxum]|uniref:C2H2-type domain-containing protein n=1 Tax=Dendrobium chrysotoxum TaxID=161865 RepID=A0AAV7GWZ0_DENCH|nr:hypothetical protein IEQ34_011155 [Dendrobium chrysotoxum]
MFTIPSPSSPPAASSQAPPPLPSLDNAASTKRKSKRRPAGTPDPEAEVVSLSPQTLLASNRYVCEICNLGFQREQNLQMHRRPHKVPWKLVKRNSDVEAHKRVFVCPEPTCLHHDPTHALGDLVGIKKHFKRKHSAHRQWACARCSKAFAVHSDYKAHLKTCGTRDHSCDCGRVFSRMESFIEHQGTCTADQAQPEFPALNLHRPVTAAATAPTLQPNPLSLELQLLPTTSVRPAQPSISTFTSSTYSDQADATKLELSIFPTKARANEARQLTKQQIEIMAEEEFANAKRIREEARIVLNKALALREHASKKIHSTLLQITCFSCKLKYYAELAPEANMRTYDFDNSLAASCISSILTEED